MQFSHLSINDELPYSHVLAIKQDAKRYMWIGTRKGLFRYDGYTISPVKSADSIGSHYIRQILVDKNDDVWVVYFRKIYKYASNKELMVNVPVNPGNNPSFSLINSPFAKIAESSDGRIFMLTINCLFIFNNQKNEFEPYEIIHNKILTPHIYNFVADKNQGLWIIDSKALHYIDLKTNNTTEYNIKNFFSMGRLSRVMDMLVDYQNNLWIATFGDGILLFDRKTGDFKALNNKTGYDINIARVLLEDNQKQLWVGGEDGLRVLDIEKKEIVETIKQDYQNPLGINDNATHALFQDKEGNIWIGGYFGGINILYKDKERFNYYPPGYRSNNVSGKAIRQIVEDGAYLWIATEDGGLNKYHKATREFQHFTTSPNGIRSKNIHSLLKDKKGNLWLGTFDAGVNILNTKTNQVKYINMMNTPQLRDDMIFSLLEDNDGIIYIGTVNGLLLYDPAKNSFHTIEHPIIKERFIHDMMLDSQNNIWIGTHEDGLIVYNKAKNVIKVYTQSSKEGSLKENRIAKIFEDSFKRVWIGTANKGLFLYDRKTDSFKSVLNVGNRGISGIVEDNNKTLWISSEKGLAKIDLQTNETFNYTKDDGLYSDNFNVNSAIKTREGELFFGTINGLISFKPEAIGEKLFKPNVILTKLHIGGEEVSVYSNNSPLETSLDESAEITLSYNQASSFAIEYAAIYYGHSQSLKYAVYMEGVDKTWNFLNDQRRVNFSRLPTGRYTFNVKAVSSNEDWGNAPVRSLIITVKPPFHLSVWAWMIYLIVASVIAYLVNHFLRLRRQEKQQIQLERLERSKIEEINRTKIDFFTNISHELKTPLTLIISPLQRLIDNGTPKDLLHEITEVILRNAQRMSRIVDELMTFSKIEIGKEKLTLHKGNVLEFISNISNTFRLLAKEKDINFISIIEDNGEDVWFSITNIEKIVYNLLSNSFKFTPAGGSISIQARLTEEHDNKIYLNIIVTDSGEGIEKQYLDRIFENYFQADLNSNLRGSGIGLSLTKRLINLHNGSISVDSNVGEGSTFSVAVDVSESSYSRDEKTTKIFDKDFFKKYNYITIGHEIIEKNNILEDEHNEDYIKSILLVEDNDELLKFLYDIFRDNYRVFTAENGEIALEIANTEYPDLIISDVMMPVMDGFELCKRIKSDFSTCHIPLILLTAKTGTDDKLEGYGMGADYYIEKPFNARMLEIQVQNIIKTRLSNIESLRNNPQKNVSSTLMNERDCSFVTKLNELIEENIDNQFFSISDITKALNVSRTLLHVKCKKLINVSVTDYIRETRMHKAKALLTAGQNISETAYALGFSDPGYFSKVFKKQFNISPSDFIKNLGESEESD